MYQVSTRQTGECFVCPGVQEVVELKKGSKAAFVCRKHLWEGLQATAPAPEKKKPRPKSHSGERDPDGASKGDGTPDTAGFGSADTGP